MIRDADYSPADARAYREAAETWTARDAIRPDPDVPRRPARWLDGLLWDARYEHGIADTLFYGGVFGTLAAILILQVFRHLVAAGP